MIIISREEAMALRAKFGDDANISITNRHKKGGRKKYYLPEEVKLMSFLNRLRNKQQRKFAGNQTVGREVRNYERKPRRA